MPSWHEPSTSKKKKHQKQVAKGPRRGIEWDGSSRHGASGHKKSAARARTSTWGTMPVEDTVATDNSSMSSSLSQESYDPYRVGANDDDDDSSDDDVKESKDAKRMVKRSIEWCKTGDLTLTSLAGSTDADTTTTDSSRNVPGRAASQALKFLESKNWWGKQGVVVVGSTTSASSSKNTPGHPSEKNHADDDATAPISLSGPTCKPPNARHHDDSDQEEQDNDDSSNYTTEIVFEDTRSEGRRTAPARTRTGCLKEMFEKTFSESKLIGIKMPLQLKRIPMEWKKERETERLFVPPKRPRKTKRLLLLPC